MPNCQLNKHLPQEWLTGISTAAFTELLIIRMALSVHLPISPTSVSGKASPGCCPSQSPLILASSLPRAPQADAVSGLVGLPLSNVLRVLCFSPSHTKVRWQEERLSVLMDEIRSAGLGCGRLMALQGSLVLTASCPASAFVALTAVTGIWVHLC